MAQPPPTLGPDYWSGMETIMGDLLVDPSLRVTYLLEELDPLSWDSITTARRAITNAYTARFWREFKADLHLPRPTYSGIKHVATVTLQAIESVLQFGGTIDPLAKKALESLQKDPRKSTPTGVYDSVIPPIYGLIAQLEPDFDWAEEVNRYSRILLDNDTICGMPVDPVTMQIRCAKCIAEASLNLMALGHNLFIKEMLPFLLDSGVKHLRCHLKKVDKTDAWLRRSRGVEIGFVKAIWLPRGEFPEVLEIHRERFEVIKPSFERAAAAWKYIDLCRDTSPPGLEQRIVDHAKGDKPMSIVLQREIQGIPDRDMISYLAADFNMHLARLQEMWVLVLREKEEEAFDTVPPVLRDWTLGHARVLRRIMQINIMVYPEAYTGLSINV